MRPDNFISSLRFWEYKSLPKYPHLSAPHGNLMGWFISMSPKLFERVAYDVPCGNGSAAQVSAPPPFVKDWSYLTSCKIDALAQKKNIFGLIEIKIQGDFTGCGQLLGYRSLLYSKLPPGSIIQLIYVVDRLLPDAEQFCIENNILIADFSKPFPSEEFKIALG